MKESKGPSRRRFCACAGALLGGCTTGGARLSLGFVEHDAPDGGGFDLARGDLAQDPGACGSGLVDAGAATAIAAGTGQRFTDGSSYDFWLCRDAAGLYAVENVCTHAGCPVRLINAATTYFYCNCHGATFDFNGQHATAPAFGSLNHLAVCLDPSGHALVDPQTYVDAATRV